MRLDTKSINTTHIIIIGKVEYTFILSDVYRSTLGLKQSVSDLPMYILTFNKGNVIQNTNVNIRVVIPYRSQAITSDGLPLDLLSYFCQSFSWRA